MRFSVAKQRDNVLMMARRIGYRPLGRDETGEFSFVRPLRVARYPRFHAYITDEKESIVVNLHLDQKQPSYEGTAAHSGEYEGPLVNEEVARIKSILE